MKTQIETMQKFGNDALEANAKSFGVVKTGTQVMATDALDYGKKSFEHRSRALSPTAGSVPGSAK